MIELNNLYQKYKMISPLTVKAGLLTKVPTISEKTALKGLYELTKKFPKFTELDFIKDKDEFTLHNKEVDIKKGIFFTIKEYSSFEYTCGIGSNIDFKEELINIIDTIEKLFNINAFNIKLIDIRYISISEWEDNYNKIILNTFFKNSPLSLLFEPENILNNDLFIRGYLDKNRRVIINIENNNSDNEILNKKYKNDILKATVGIANIDIPLDVKLSETYLQHYNIVYQYIKDKFIPNVLIPLDDVLAKASKNKSNEKG